MTKVFSGRSQISGWDEKPSIEHDDGAKQSHAQMTQRYSGDVKGSGDIQYLMCYQSAGSTLFVGFEMVTGSLHRQSGSFVMQHTGQQLPACGVTSKHPLRHDYIAI